MASQWQWKILPRFTAGDGIRVSAGTWADGDVELEQWLKYLRRARRSGRRATEPWVSLHQMLRCCRITSRPRRTAAWLQLPSALRRWRARSVRCCWRESRANCRCRSTDLLFGNRSKQVSVHISPEVHKESRYSLPPWVITGCTPNYLWIPLATWWLRQLVILLGVQIQ